MEGKGEFFWSDGRTYSGHYAGDRKSGHGVMTWSDGRVFDGEWNDGK